MGKREKIQTVPVRDARINIRASNDLLEALVELAAEVFGDAVPTTKAIPLR